MLARIHEGLNQVSGSTPVCRGFATGRKSRRGVSLVETGFTLLLATVFLSWATNFLGERRFSVALRSEAREVSRVATALAVELADNLSVEAANTFAATNQMIEHSVTSLSGNASVSYRAATTRKRPIRLLAYAPSQDQIIVIAYASFTGSGRTAAPQSELGNVGWVSPLSPTRVNAPGIDLDVSAIQAQFTDLGAGDIVAFEFLSVGQDVSPYLHRVAVPGRPELNRMEVDLDLGNNSILNADGVTATSVTTSAAMSAQQVSGDFNVSGDLNVGGSLSVSGTLQVNGNLDVTDNVTASSLNLSGTLSADSLIGDQLTTATAFSTSAGVLGTTSSTAIYANTFMGQSAEIGTMNASRLEADEVGVNGQLSAQDAWSNTLNVGSCTGC